MSAKTRNILKLLRPTLKLPRRFASRYINFDDQPNKYGGKTNISVLPGIGIGPEIMDSTLKVLKAAEAPLTFEVLPLPQDLNEDEDDTEFYNALTSIRRNRVALKGNIEFKSKNHFESGYSRNMLLRKTLDLYVYVLWVKAFPGIQSKFTNMDTIVVRQNTEGEYLMLEHEPRHGSVENLKIITRHASEKMADFAFKFAIMNSRKRVTIVHNADVQNYGEGLFVDAALSVSKKYPSIFVEVTEVGVLCCRIVMKPEQYDMILATNLNGSMISNIIIGMMGGPGLYAGTNLGDDGLAVFEPGARNKGSSIFGKGTANPVAMIVAGINLLIHLGHFKTAHIIKQSVYNTLVHDRIRTQDLGGTATTEQVTQNIIRNVQRQLNTDVVLKKAPVLQAWKTYCDVTNGNIPKLQFPKES